MTKSVYQFWLSNEITKEKIRLPVLPSRLDINNQTRNETLKVAKLGEITFIEDPDAAQISFSSFFPLATSSLTEYVGFKKPEEYVDMINRWMKNRQHVRFLVTGTKVNYPVSIESFVIHENGGEVGDQYYDISLKEYKVAIIKKIKVAAKKTTSTRPVAAKKSKTYTVKRGDTLWAIAGRPTIYGKNTEWRKIWNANKDMLVKRDRRNLKQPGHWIFPGQVLKIP